MGCVSALGIGVEAFWRELTAGRHGFRPHVPEQAADQAERLLAHAWDYRSADHFSDDDLRMLDRNAQIAIVACREAVSSAGLPLGPDTVRRTAVVIGTTIGGMSTLDESFYRLYGERKDRLHPFTVPRLITNAAASHAAIQFGVTGPVMAIASACSSANNAVGEALWMIRAGRIDAAIAGGTEACLTFGCIRAWEALRVVARDCCRPFSAGRSGLVLGEAAGIVVLVGIWLARRGST